MVDAGQVQYTMDHQMGIVRAQALALLACLAGDDRHTQHDIAAQCWLCQCSGGNGGTGGAPACRCLAVGKAVFKAEHIGGVVGAAVVAIQALAFAGSHQSQRDGGRELQVVQCDPRPASQQDVRGQAAGAAVTLNVDVRDEPAGTDAGCCGRLFRSGRHDGRRRRRCVAPAGDAPHRHW